MILSENIKRIRKENNLSQEQLAEQLRGIEASGFQMGGRAELSRNGETFRNM